MEQNKIRKNSIIVLFLTIIILYFILKDNLNEVIHDIGNTNYFLLLIALGVYMLSYVFDALSYYYVVKQYKKDYVPKKAFRLNT